MRVLLGAALLVAGCEIPCKVSSQCAPGQRCHPRGECVSGCQSDTDCDGVRSVCDRNTGLCRLTTTSVSAPVDLGLTEDQG